MQPVFIGLLHSIHLTPHALTANNNNVLESVTFFKGNLFSINYTLHVAVIVGFFLARFFSTIKRILIPKLTRLKSTFQMTEI